MLSVGPESSIASSPGRMTALSCPASTDIQAVYEEWSARGVPFITSPSDNGGYEIRCYIRDPDGRIIEVGEHIGMPEIFTLG